MNKEEWIDKFQELLWRYHTCDWDEGNRYPNHPWHLAVSYYESNESVEEAFQRYVKDYKDD